MSDEFIYAVPIFIFSLGLFLAAFGLTIFFWYAKLLNKKSTLGSRELRPRKLNPRKPKLPRFNIV